MMYLCTLIPSFQSVLVAGCLILLFVVIFQFVFGEEDEVPKFYCTEHTPMVRHVLERCKLMSAPFRPVFWLRNGHLQTLLDKLCPPADVKFIREYIPLLDGGKIALDWAEEHNRSDIHKHCPVFVVIPGITGGADGMSDACKLGLTRGFRPVIFNKRGHGGSEISTAKLQSIGDPDDFAQAVKFIKERYPDCKMAALGNSAGSAVLASYLGKYGSSSLIDVGVGLSPGYDVQHLWDQGIVQPYHYFILRGLKHIVKRHSDLLAKVADVGKALEARNLTEFEELIYYKIYRHQTMDEHWKQNDVAKEVHKIRVPFLCINSLDDPVCRKECINYSLFTEHSNAMLLTTNRGGHCGFFEGFNLERWSDKVTLDFITTVLEYRAANEEQNCS